MKQKLFGHLGQMATRNLGLWAIPLAIIVALSLCAVLVYFAYLSVTALDARLGIGFWWTLTLVIVLTLELKLTDNGNTRTIGLLPTPIRKALGWAIFVNTVVFLVQQQWYWDLAVIGLILVYRLAMFLRSRSNARKAGNLATRANLEPNQDPKVITDVPFKEVNK